MVPVLFTFYIQGVVKLRNNSGAKKVKHIYCITKNFLSCTLNRTRYECKQSYITKILSQGNCVMLTAMLEVSDKQTGTTFLGKYANWRTAMAQWLRCGRSLVRSRLVSLDFLLTYSFRSHNGPGVDSSSNRNEYSDTSANEWPC